MQQASRRNGAVAPVGVTGLSPGFVHARSRETVRTGKPSATTRAGRVRRRQRRRVHRLVAPLNDGVRRVRVELPERAEPVAQLGGVELGLLPGGEVPAAVDLVVVDEVGVRLL